MSDNVRKLSASGREFILVGTAHISKESVDEVLKVIREEAPDMVCVEIDEGRYRSMSADNGWADLDVAKVLKQKKGFLLLANLVLASFQRRLGGDEGMKPGREMLAAIEEAKALGIPYAFCDREIQVTLRRAWSESNFWNKAKLISALIGSGLSREKLSQSEIEDLKAGSALDDMMAELAKELPTVKRTLIDERDRYLAAKIHAAGGSKVVAVLGAGHREGVERWLKSFEQDPGALDVAELEVVKSGGKAASIVGWIIPALIVGIITLGFFRSGSELSLALLVRWVILNGSLAAVGCVAALAHPLTIIVALLGAPIATLNPFLAVGLFAGISEATLRKPAVRDFERLSEDIMSVRGFYRNRITRVLLVFFLSSLGGAIGNFISLPFLSTLVL